jgi:membrane protein DedA with SNARE-associated domain
MLAIIDNAVDLLVEFVVNIGYLGIFIGMFLESTVFPLPSELVMIPAGLAVAKGAMNFWLAIIIGTAGNVLGALFSYYLAKYFGRILIIKIGKYFFVKEEVIAKIEVFFGKYGNISVFFGRLLIGFRHFISLPAGLAKMDVKLFLLYTTAGSALWTSFLVTVGFFFGNNLMLIKTISLILLSICFLALLYHFLRKKFASLNGNGNV